MKRKLLTACAALLAASSLSSCYVYDDPLTWANPRQNFGGGYGYNSYHHHAPAYCAPPPPPCYNGGYGHHGW